MKRKLFFAIALRILSIGATGFLTTYISDYFSEVLFDDKPNGYGGYVWGRRHYWYFITMLCLLVLTLVDGVMFVGNMYDTYYPKTPVKEPEPCKHDWQPSVFSSPSYPEETCILCNAKRGRAR